MEMIGGLRSTMQLPSAAPSKGDRTASAHGDQMFGHIYNRKQLWSAVEHESYAVHGRLSFVNCDPHKSKIRVPQKKNY